MQVEEKVEEISKKIEIRSVRYFLIFLLISFLLLQIKANPMNFVGMLI